jgi:hypothetical protein
VSKSRVKITDIDRGYNALVRSAFGMNRVLKVGLLEATPSNVLEYGSYNEFGTSTIPERSFIRDWFDSNLQKCRDAVRVMAYGVLSGKYQPDQALELLGARFAAEIQARMSTSIPPANAPSTVRQKGSSTTLIDTGVLRGSISYEVE